MASLNKIILHWTAGTNKANQVERDHYHYIVQGDGSVTLGKLGNSYPIRIDLGKISDWNIGPNYQ